jgi:hypothetical protein
MQGNRERIHFHLLRLRYRAEPPLERAEFSPQEAEALTLLHDMEQRRPIILCAHCGCECRNWSGVIDEPKLCHVCRAAARMIMRAAALR